MKKSEKRISRFLAVLLALSFYLSPTLAVNANESNNVEIGTILENEIQPRGVLSGYGQQYTSGRKSGSFDFNVTGSWSAFAGCTVKFDGFPSGTTIKYTLTQVSNNQQKFSRSFTINSSDNEDNNIAIFNVATGTYRLTWELSNIQTGTIHCYVY